MEELLQIFKHPSKQIFWDASTAILFLATILGGIFSFFYSHITKNSISERTKIIIDGQIEIFENWVKITSSTQEIDDNNIELWLSNEGGVINLGRNYKIYKRFISRINLKQNKRIHLMIEDKFNKIVKEYDNAPKFGRSEW